MSNFKLLGGLLVVGLLSNYHLRSADAQQMYWTDVGSSRIQRANLDGTEVEDLVTSGVILPVGIALDVPGAKMYWTDIGTGKIQRANLDGTVGEDLVTIEATTPVGIALDPAGGKMYWSEGSPADFMILRSDLDGANI